MKILPLQVGLKRLVDASDKTGYLMPVSMANGDDITYRLRCTVQNRTAKTYDNGILYFTKYIDVPDTTVASLAFQDMYMSWTFLNKQPTNDLYVRSIDTGDTVIRAILNEEADVVGLFVLEQSGESARFIDVEQQSNVAPGQIKELLEKALSCLDDLYVHHQLTFTNIEQYFREKAEEN